MTSTLSIPAASTLTARDRVRTVVGAGLTPAGTTGMVVDMDPSLLNPYDVAVQVDGRGYGPMRFFAVELERISD